MMACQRDLMSLKESLRAADAKLASVTNALDVAIQPATSTAMQVSGTLDRVVQEVQDRERLNHHKWCVGIYIL